MKSKIIQLLSPVLLLEKYASKYILEAQENIIDDDRVANRFRKASELFQRELDSLKSIKNDPYYFNRAMVLSILKDLCEKAHLCIIYSKLNQVEKSEKLFNEMQNLIVKIYILKENAKIISKMIF